MMATSSARTHEGLAVVIGAGWLSFYQLRSLECTCLYVCGESRRQVARKVRVTLETPRTLWDAGGRTVVVCNGSSGNTNENSTSTSTSDGHTVPERKRVVGSGGGHKFAWHTNPSARGKGAADAITASADGAGSPIAARSPPAAAAPPPRASTSSTASATEAKRSCFTRVPSVRPVGIIWQLPVTELLSPAFAWPRGVKDVHFWSKFDDRLDGVIFPETLETLTFGFHFNKSLGPGHVRWPPRLRRLRFGAMWNRRLSGCRESWPASLEILEFGTGFDKPLQGGDGTELPPGLREIHLGGVFNQPLAGVEWPPTLRKLTFSEYFNRSLEYAADGSGVSFPSGLQEMSFMGRFDQEVARVAWPESLTSLTFGDTFNRPFVSPGVGSSGVSGGAAAAARRGPTGAASASPSRSFGLPAGLRVLVLGDDFDHPLSRGELPDSLLSLMIGKSFSFTSSVRWPAQLKRLELACRWSGGGEGEGEGGRSSAWLMLPSALEYLDVGDRFNSPLDKIVFPASLRVLVLGSAFDQPLDHSTNRRAGNIDPLRGNCDLPIPSPLLPEGLEELRLGAAFNSEIENSRLPRRLKRLIFVASSKFDRPVADVAWPPALEELRFGNYFDQPVESGGEHSFDSLGDGRGGWDSVLTLPATLRDLHFGWAFSYSLQRLVLPQSLQRLSFCARYPVSHVKGLEWPPSLRSIVVGSFEFSCRRDLAKWHGQLPF